uniref:Uncharacterized protein n=1 Tax=Rhodnius prolixus TaxID=13249 RepID=T1H7P6_RHOPR
MSNGIRSKQTLKQFISVSNKFKNLLNSIEYSSHSIGHEEDYVKSYLSFREKLVIHIAWDTLYIKRKKNALENDEETRV